MNPCCLYTNHSGGPSGWARWPKAYLKFQPKAQEKKFIAQLSGYGASSAVRFLAAASSAIRSVSGSPRDWREASALGAASVLGVRPSTAPPVCPTPPRRTPYSRPAAASASTLKHAAVVWLGCVAPVGRWAAALPSRRRHKHNLFPPRLHPSRLELRIQNSRYEISQYVEP